MNAPTWEELRKYHCSQTGIPSPTPQGFSIANPHFEPMAHRRYNYSASTDAASCRLVFLGGVLENPTNRTLMRSGRFIWCKNLMYEGLGEDGLRHISFTIDSGKKRFYVSEANVLCIPSKTFITNNLFCRSREKTFSAFSSVFAYQSALRLMKKSSKLDRSDFVQKISTDNPHRPGTLVSPRLGYFYPTTEPADATATHPYGIILAPSFNNTDYSGREFYRVRFGGTTYEKVHPVQMEIINEV